MVNAGKGSAVPGQNLSGRTSFAWAEGGAFLVIRSQTDYYDFPDGIATFGSDDVLGTITMHWLDERGISGLRPVRVARGTVTWHYNDPAFMRRVTITADAGGSHMISKGETAKNGAAWTDDLSQEFYRG